MGYCSTSLLLLIQWIAGKNYALDNSYVYDLSPVPSSFDIRCILDNIEFARAIKYQSGSSTCEKLSQSWNNNRTFESGYFYAWVRWYESSFTEALSKTLTFPDNFDFDCRLDVVVETTDVILNGFYVNIRDPLNLELYIHLSIRPTDAKAVLNTKINTTWLDEIYIPIDGFANQNFTEYTSSFVLKQTHWEVYIDSAFLGNFTHVHPYSGKGTVQCESISGDVFCKQMIFHGP